MGTNDWMARWEKYSPNKVAIKEIETGRKYTYREINHIANLLAYEFINDHKLKKGDRVMILAEHCLEYIILFAISQKIGIVLVPINYRLAPSEVDYLIDNCSPELLICEEKFKDKVSDNRIASSIKIRWSMDDLAKRCQSLLEEPSTISYVGQIDGEDPLFILYTSGTTGFPKGSIYTHKMLFWNSMNTSIGLNITSDDVTVLCMPPFHTGGWNVLLTPILHRGGTVGILKKFDGAQILKALETEKANIFMGVPTMLKMMSDADEFTKTDLSTIRYFIVGGEALPLPVIETWHNKGVKLRQGYGLTEVGPNLTSLHHDDAIRKIGSIGKPNFYVESKIVDEDDVEVPIGEIGEFCFKGDIVTPGYWKNDEAMKKSLIDGWFHTGDLVKMDDDGYLYVMDRKKNMFISGGENVYPAEVERIICQHPKVSEVAVTAVPDDKWGEVGHAFIVVKGDVTEEIISIYCKENMARFKVPKYFSFIEALPKTDSGKIDRKALANQF